MSPPGPLPYRPRLADHVALRRHLVDGSERIFAQDDRTAEIIELRPQQLTWLLCADGTRDVGGILLAAVRAHAYERSSDVIALLGSLHERHMLADGIEPGDAPREAAPNKPLEPLEGYSLSCDANGSCCGTYGSVAFSRQEAERARALVPDALPDPQDLTAFLPLRGSAPTAYGAVTMVDGHCPYLATDGRCRVQLAANPQAKPLGCRIFPATFADDGTTIRVSVAVECPCVLRSLEVDGGASLIPPAATTEADLHPACPIVRLPAAILVSPEHACDRAELRRWADAVLVHTAETDDGVAALWSLADAAGDHGLSVEAARAALARAAPPAPAALMVPLMSLAARAQAKDESLQAWRSTVDRTRQLSHWLSHAAQALQEPACLKRQLAQGPRQRSHEQFYLRACIFGHQLIEDDRTVEQGLRDRATRLLLARQMGDQVPEGCQDHPAVPYPITAVESMMRGQGLAG